MDQKKCYLASLLTLVFLQATFCDNCEDLTGEWYNSLGSEMIITSHREDGLLIGEYRTAVERNAGAAGDSHSIVAGTAAYSKAGSTFAFSVSWREGMSTTIWTGECMMCEGMEVIMTTWLLRSVQSSCLDKWKSTLIGQDFFTREEQRIGPRKRFGVDVPLGRSDTPGSRRKRDEQAEKVLSMERRALGLDEEYLDREKRQTEDTSCEIAGTWYNEIGSKVELAAANENSQVSGTYMTGKERQARSLSGHHSALFGLSNPNLNNRTLSLMIDWRDGASVTGWVGQCQICEDEDGNDIELLETAWIHRVQVDSCEKDWRSTLYGQNSFFRETFRPVDANAEIEGQFGEDVVDETNIASSITTSGALSVIAMAIIYQISIAQ